METAVTRGTEGSDLGLILHLALELAEKRWRLAFTIGLGQKPRRRSVGAGDLDGVAREVAAAKRRFRLPQDVRVASCYEAGMEGFWLHRALVERGIENYVVDSSSIDVNRRRRRAKTDRLDEGALSVKLVRFIAGERKVWSVVRVPPEEAEDLRHNERELQRLREERTAVVNAVRGLLKTQGIRLARLKELPNQLRALRLWNGKPLREELHARLLRYWERMQVVEEQIKEVVKRREAIEQEGGDAARKSQQLQMLKAVGPNIAWVLITEIFGWRTFSNRRELGGLVGLGAVPYQSGESSRDLGISKVGRRRLRGTLIELAWLWVRYQPASPITQWFMRKYAAGGKRLRRIGIVGVARRLLIELWKYLQTSALPEGAMTKA